MARATPTSPERTLPRFPVFGKRPLVEEVLFRGILYPSVKQLGYPRLALWGTSLFFGLIHSNLMTFVPLTVLSLLLVWLYERTGNLLAPILTHLKDAGLGHISEIADAELPHTPRGCPFQAWSVGEALRLDRVVLAERERVGTRTSVRLNVRKKETACIPLVVLQSKVEAVPGKVEPRAVAVI